MTPEPPSAPLAHIGGSGTWAFPYPDGALDGHPHLSVEVVHENIQLATPYGPSPSFRLCRLTDGRTRRSTDYRGNQVYAVALLAALLSFLVYSAVHVIGRRLDWQGAARDRA